MPPIPEPRAAATVLLLRDRADGRFEVFMVQRSMKSSFMPGAYVFPGGAVDPEDFDCEMTRSGGVEPAEASARFGGALDEPTALAHLAAAAREVAEEAHVHLPDISSMRVFSRWVTPAIESRRFDAWFLVDRMPRDAVPGHDDFETVASRWVEPRDALARYGDGDMVMAPPTYYTVWDLARFDSVDDVLADASGRTVVPVQPDFREVEGRWTILLPGDPLNPSETPVEGPTRIVMGEGGRWWVVDGTRSQLPAE